MKGRKAAKKEETEGRESMTSDLNQAERTPTAAEQQAELTSSHSWVFLKLSFRGGKKHSLSAFLHQGCCPRIRLLPLPWMETSFSFPSFRSFPSGSEGKESACSAGDSGLILGPESPLEEGMAIHSSILAWRIPWTEEPGGLQSTGLQRVGHDSVGYDWTTNTFTFQVSGGTARGKRSG